MGEGALPDFNGVSCISSGLGVAVGPGPSESGVVDSYRISNE